MPTYEIIKDKASGSVRLVSKHYSVIAVRERGHVWVKVSGDQYATGRAFRVQALTAIHDAVTDFEMKVILLHFYRQARDFGKNMPTIKYINYASIFGSCFD